MKHIFTSAFAVVLFSFFTGCSSSSNATENPDCENSAQIINEEAFNLINTVRYSITRVSLNEDCLNVTISSSGCEGNSWTTKLFSSSASNPAQKNVKLDLTNPEVCLAIFEKTFSFDLIPLRANGQNQVTLNLTGWPTPINYQY